jgi:hypothetical protein
MQNYASKQNGPPIWRTAKDQLTADQFSTVTANFAVFSDFRP